MSKKNKKGLPKGWKQSTLGDMLPEPHYTKFLDMWRQYNGDMLAVTKALREYLEPFKAEFSARGLDTGYVSYAVPFHFAQAVKSQQMDQQADQAHNAWDIANDIMRQKSNPWN